MVNNCIFKNTIFRSIVPFDKRKYESDRIMIKYKDRIPIIVECEFDISKNINLDKHKYLVPRDINVAQFMYIIRSRIKLNSNDSLFMFFDNIIKPSTETIGNIYKYHKNADGFLYAMITLENTFG
jgi:GABA(A) receptor-associated protein